MQSSIPAGGGSSTRTSARIRSAVEEDIFDDACDLGQFFLNPVWYCFVKAQKFLENRKRASASASASEGASTTSGSSEGDRDCPRTRKTKFLSKIQQIFYLSAFYSCWAVIFAKALPLIRASDHLSNVHIHIAYGLFGCCIASWVVAKWTPPGTITPETMRKYDHYPYDGVLYQRQQTCPTQNIRKLARSKYDRFSHTHVPRFDHYCGWLGNTVGEENYRFFLAFTVTHTFLFTYGTVVLVRLLWTEAATLTTTTTTSIWKDKLVLAASGTHSTIAATAVLCAVLSFPALQMFGFHFHLLSKGMTTNEHYKWKAIVARQRRYNEGEGAKSLQLTVEETTTIPPSALSRRCVEDVECREKSGEQPPQCQGGMPPQIDIDISGSDLPPATYSSSSLVSMAKQQQFYNLGFIQNLHEALFPRSFGKEGGKKES